MIRCQITNGLYSRDPHAWMHTLSRDADLIQIRERDLTARQLAGLTMTVLAKTSARVLVNDRIDVAVACGAAGVHLRSGSVDPRRVKARWPLMVTVACHNREDFTVIEGADYALLAPIFPPLSKEASGPTLGLEGLKECARRSRIPILALGGITRGNAASCVEAGAAGVAGISFYT
ncbi:MAG: thiamine phosphate synthase [Acidobacteriota bacterium]|nr:thiamine phosphate synthase [Acidobacteriota bacterium]